MNQRDRDYVDKLAQKIFIALIKKDYKEVDEEEAADDAYNSALAYYQRRYEKIIKGYELKYYSETEALYEILSLDGYCGEFKNFVLKQCDNKLQLYTKWVLGHEKSAGQDAIIMYFKKSGTC